MNKRSIRHSDSLRSRPPLLLAVDFTYLRRTLAHRCTDLIVLHGLREAIFLCHFIRLLCSFTLYRRSAIPHAVPPSASLLPSDGYQRCRDLSDPALRRKQIELRRSIPRVLNLKPYA